jgi:type I restriction enzyme S subunit
MIHNLEPYPRYRDTGLPWIGELPEHWKAPRLKTVFHEVDQRSGTGVEPLLSLRMREGLVDHHETGGKPIPAAGLTHYKVTRPGELVMNRMRAAIGLFGLPPKVGLVSPDYAVLRPRMTVELRYFLNFFRSPGMMSIFRLESHGLGTGESGFLRLYTEQFGKIPTPLPPLPEQAAIVRFLDHADRRIRRYIAAKKKLIALLKEQKQAIINRAVTRGLDPDVRLRPSGVEGLGDMPEHWQLRRMKTLVDRIDQGVSPQAENLAADDGSWGVLKAGCVNRGVFRESEHKRLPTGFTFDQSLAVAEGDVLISRASGSPSLVGSAGRVPPLTRRLILSDKIFRPVFRAAADPDFMVLAMNSRSFRLQVERAISGAEGLANNLPLSSLRSFVFGLPPVGEQRTIVGCVSGSIDRLDAAVDHASREIALLHEYRSRLIADLVTGKIDVREAAAGLLDEVEEPELLDADVLAEGDGTEDEADLDAAAGEVEG